MGLTSVLGDTSVASCGGKAYENMHAYISERDGPLTDTSRGPGPTGTAALAVGSLRSTSRRGACRGRCARHGARGVRA